MKVLWIADFSTLHNMGGAQRTDSLIIEEGLSRGINIERFFYDSDISLLSNNYDIVVSGNLEHLNRHDAVFNFIVNHNRHVRFEHDANAYLTQKKRKELFGSCKQTIFLSDYHYSVFVQRYGEIFNNVAIVNSPIDIEKFKDLGQEREDKTLFAGFMHPFKGIQNFFDKVVNNPDQQFAIAGWGHPLLEHTAKLMKNLEWLGTVAYQDMPALFNRYKRFYYHPTHFEPFCRSVAEAMFCGMEMDCGDNIGAIHERNRMGVDELKRLCSLAPKTFWDKINE